MKCYFYLLYVIDTEIFYICVLRKFLKTCLNHYVCSRSVSSWDHATSMPSFYIKKGSLLTNFWKIIRATEIIWSMPQK